MKQRTLAAVAVAAALGAGAVAGAFLGVPGLSGAQTPSPSASASPSPGPGGHRVRPPGFGFRAPSLQAAATALNMSVADLKTALQSGQSLAGIAKSKNVDVQKVIGALVADATSRIDAAVSSGRITAAQAATMKSNLTSRITALVNRSGPKLPGVTSTAVPGFKGHWAFGPGLHPSLDIIAKDLNMAPTDVKAALAGGQSIAALAKSKNVDVQKVINDLVADATSRIDAAVSSGKITAAQAATMKSNLTSRITALVNQTPHHGGMRGPGKGFGFGPGHWGDHLSPSVTPTAGA